MGAARARAMWGVAVLGYVAVGVRLRRRLAAIPVLTGADDVDSSAHRSDHRVIAAGGVRVDPATRRAASLHARRHGLDVLDLVPTALPTERLADLAHRVDFERFRHEPLALGVGAGCAVLATAEVLERAGIDPDAAYDEVDLLVIMRTLKRFAPTSSAHAFAPGLDPPEQRDDAAWRRAAAEASLSLAAPASFVARGAQLGALAVGATLGPGGAAVAAAYCLQVAIGVGGTPARPPDLWRRTFARLPLACLDVVRIVGARRRTEAIRLPVGRSHVPATATARTAYERDFRAGARRLFHEQRRSCPLCAAGELSERVSVGELHQGKPGRFTLDECAGCGLVFQNPALTDRGLDVYYRDFYDGLGEEQTELAFTSHRAIHRRRIEMVARHAEPRRWLDVGAGHGHFCLEARARWPKATFDGIDLAASIDQAERRGWVDRGTRGLFPSLAADPDRGLASSYDVVSMHHYLEHTRDPRVEIDAAAAVLEPGGLLMVEVPDPDAATARLLGPAWLAYMQPQHLNLVPRALLQALLEERGFSVVEVHHRSAHQGGDLTGAAYLAINRLAPPVDVPWRPRSTTVDRARRAGTVTAALPALAAAAMLDGGIAALTRAGAPMSNAYRVLARLD